MLNFREISHFLHSSFWLLTTGSGVQVPPDQPCKSLKSVEISRKMALLGLYFFLAFSSQKRENTPKYPLILCKCENGVKTFYRARTLLTPFKCENIFLFIPLCKLKIRNLRIFRDILSIIREFRHQLALRARRPSRAGWGTVFTGLDGRNDLRASFAVVSGAWGQASATGMVKDNGDAFNGRSEFDHPYGPP